MGQLLADKLSVTRALQTVEQSVAGIVTLLDESTRASHSGRFWNVSRNGVHEIPW